MPNTKLNDMYDKRVSLMLSKEDKTMLENEAKRERVKLSTYIRSKLLSNYVSSNEQE
jgi:hypothetical protein